VGEPGIRKIPRRKRESRKDRRGGEEGPLNCYSRGERGASGGGEKRDFPKKEGKRGGARNLQRPVFRRGEDSYLQETKKKPRGEGAGFSERGGKGHGYLIGGKKKEKGSLEKREASRGNQWRPGGEGGEKGRGAGEEEKGRVPDVGGRASFD